MKKTTLILRIALIALALVGIAHWASRNFGPRSEIGGAAGADDPLGGRDHGVVVTYFTSNARCPTCLKIEALTKKAVNDGFADELAEGSVVFRTLNIDQPENDRFTKRYDLVFKTVVVSERRSGDETRWVALDEVWDLTNEPAAFIDLVRGAVRKYLETDA